MGNFTKFKVLLISDVGMSNIFLPKTTFNLV